MRRVFIDESYEGSFPKRRMVVQMGRDTSISAASIERRTMLSRSGWEHEHQRRIDREEEKAA